MKHIKLSENLNITDINEIMKHYLIGAVSIEEEQILEREEKDISDFYGNSKGITDLVPRAEMTIENFSDDAKIRAYEDIKQFLSIDGVMDAIEEEGIDNEMIGHDIWLTRNSHGAGFWDRGYTIKNSNILTNAAKSLGQCDIELGDDGRLHFH